MMEMWAMCLPSLQPFGESDMKVAILGSGIVGQTLGAGFLKHG